MQTKAALADPYPGSAAHKKVHRQHLKSTRNRPPDETFGWTPFRAAEKKYKARYPPPDLSNVLDLALLDPDRKDEIERGVWKGCLDALDMQEIKLKMGTGDRGRRAFCTSRIPGLVILPGYLFPETQKELTHWSLYDHARWPNETNLDAHYDIPEEGIWRMHTRSLSDINNATDLILPKPPNPAAVAPPPGPRQLISNTPASPDTFTELSKQPKPPSAPSTALGSATASELLPKLRWANIGWFYHWGSKQYDFSRGKTEIGRPVKSICKEVVERINWSDVFGRKTHGLVGFGSDQDWGQGGSEWDSWDTNYEPDAGIVNFYQLKDTLMGHVDRSEVCATSPLVSISLGNAAVFLIGGLTRDVEPVPILLRSGDVLVMAGPGCRRAYHGVPRILEGSLPAHFHPSEGCDRHWTAFGRYLQTTRINVNVRQVFPKGFNPLVSDRPGS